jgi:hypothetical protein
MIGIWAKKIILKKQKQIECEATVYGQVTNNIFVYMFVVV